MVNCVNMNIFLMWGEKKGIDCWNRNRHQLLEQEYVSTLETGIDNNCWNMHRQQLLDQEYVSIVGTGMWVKCGNRNSSEWSHHTNRCKPLCKILAK